MSQQDAADGKHLSERALFSEQTHYGLSATADASLLDEDPALLRQKLMEAQVTLEELQVAEEELRCQHEHLAELQMQLEIQREQYLDLFDFAPDAYFVTDGRSRIRRANRNACSLLGIEQKYLVGKPLVLYFIAPERRAIFSYLKALIVASGKVPPWQGKIISRSGEVTDVEVTAIAEATQSRLPEVRWLVRDITARVQAERAQRMLGEAGRALATSLDLRATLKQVTNLVVPELADWCVIDLFDRTSTGDTEQPFIAATSANPAHLSAQWGARAQAPNDAYTSVPLLARGQTLGMLALGRDSASHRYCAEDLALIEALAERAAIAIDNARLFATVQQARQEAEAANRAKDEFLALLSHELRTPLNPIVGWTQLLRQGRLSADKQSQAFEVIERNARLQQQLVSDLLDVARIEQGKLTFEREQLRLTPVVRAAIEAVLPLAKEAGVKLVERLESPQNDHVVGDGTRLQQAVWNLLTNAVKFTPRGGQVEVHLIALPGALQLTVRDTGIGIAAEFVPRLFERFRQADGSSTRSRGGLGLGLFLVRQIVQAHGGTVHASSPGEGQGSTFVVLLPLCT